MSVPPRADNRPYDLRRLLLLQRLRDSEAEVTRLHEALQRIADAPTITPFDVRAFAHDTLDAERRKEPRWWVSASRILTSSSCSASRSARGFGHTPYQVGSSLTQKRGWKDVDVRLILPDDEYATYFNDPFTPAHEGLRLMSWNLAWTMLGRYMTRLPIDFQIQLALAFRRP
jgi:hypothetical protein